MNEDNRKQDYMEKTLVSKLTDLYEDAIRIYKANGKGAYEAGIVEGIKRALELVE